MRRTALALFSCVFLTACPPGGILSAPPPILVNTVRPEYTLPAGGGPARVDFFISNQTDDAVYVPRCGDRFSVALERKEATVWTEVGGTACPAVLPMVPLYVGARETVPGELTVAEAGEYRFRLYYSGEMNGDVFTELRSNEFTVR
jgi:hypothetical protein